MAEKIFIIDEVYPSLPYLLGDLGYEVDYNPNISTHELSEIIHQYEGLILRSKVILDQNLLAKATKLKFIARAGAGLDQIVEDVLVKRGIQIINAPEGNRDAVAEHTLGLLLNVMNHISKADREIRQGMWQREPNRGYELGGRTIGIIGFGNNGQCFARRLKGFEVTILAHDPYKEGFGNEFIRKTNLEDIQQQADIISLHVPLTNETKHLINSNFINKLKKPIWLINTSRGKVVDLNALLDGLDSGKIIGAGLDVLENEDLDSFKTINNQLYTRLVTHPKVVLTPHVAGWTHESYERINQVLADKIAALKVAITV